MGSIRSAVWLGRFAKFAAILILAPAVADAASFVKVVGTRTRNNAVNDSIGVIVPMSGVAAGNSIVVTAQVASLAAGAISCFDPRNGAYNMDVASAPGGAAIAIASKHDAVGLVFGDVISCSYPIFNGFSSLGVYEFAGLEGAAPLDGTSQSASASSGTASSGLTEPTSQAAELVFGFAWVPSGTTFTAATSGGSPLEDPYSPAWSQPFAAGTQRPMYRFVNSVRQYEASGAVTGTGGWIAQVATYRLAPDLCMGVDCDDANLCTADSCDPTTGLCSHTPQPAGTSCGDSSSGLCDSPDECDAAGVCRNNHVADGTPCGAVNSDCEIFDTCLAGVCHDNGVKPAGTACGDPSASQCDAPDSCNAAGTCEANHVADGTACGDAESACVNADSCAGGICDDYGFKAAGTACGDPSSSACDAADSCDGSGSCLVNHRPDGTLCGDAGTQCTNQDKCAGGACHDNGFVAAGTACGDSSSGQCDAADSCDGAGACGANHVASGTPCNDGEACTNADACDGAGLCAGARDELCFACIGNTAPVVSPAVVASPGEPVALVSGLVSVTASFTDTEGQSRTCTIEWGDGSAPDSGVVTEPTATDPGTCTGVHLYTAVGVYVVSITVADPCGESAGAVQRYPVVYDGRAGFVAGSGWVDSPAGAFAGNRALTGKADFGFVSPYGKGNAIPPGGAADFQFHVAGFDFASTAWESPLISGSKARFRGTGQVNGAGRYGFALTAVDGQAPGGGGVDRIRIRIWDQNRGDAVVYDNQVACGGNQGDNAEPCSTLGAGSIVINKK